MGALWVGGSWRRGWRGFVLPSLQMPQKGHKGGVCSDLGDPNGIGGAALSWADGTPPYGAAHRGLPAVRRHHSIP